MEKLHFGGDPALLLKRDPEVKNMGRSRGEFEHLINPSKVNVMKELLLNQKPWAYEKAIIRDRGLRVVRFTLPDL
jgi:hypothetical protein